MLFTLLSTILIYTTFTLCSLQKNQIIIVYISTFDYYLQGCVNALNFNEKGNLLASASDDLAVVIWDWALGKKRHWFMSGHTRNMFQVCINMALLVTYEKIMFLTFILYIYLFLNNFLFITLRLNGYHWAWSTSWSPVLEMVKYVY